MVPPLFPMLAAIPIKFPDAVYCLAHKHSIGNFCVSWSDNRYVQHPISYANTLLPKTAPAILEDLTLDGMRRINIINLESF